MSDRLAPYRHKRDLTRSPEPAGTEAGSDGARFVIQEHHATRLHWDLRLERDGVLASWALPKGVPSHPDENRLAVRTEDHPLEYLEFHGEIPKGTYGAGTMKIWDQGTYDCEKWREDEVIVVLRGERVGGRYALFHTRGKDWMIHRMDPPADPGVGPMPEEIRPMLACPGKLPRDDDAYGYEVKWDGVRAIAHVDSGHVTLTGRNGTDFTARYPEVRAIGEQLGARRMVLDGEVVAFDADGRPSFERLQTRMHLGSESAVRRRMKDVPVAYVIFDLLWLEGHSTVSLPYADRRRLLEELELNGRSWQTPANRIGGGSELLEAATAQGLEGVVAKRLDSPYEPGRRSRCWIKVKNRPVQDVVIGGWLPGEGRRGKTLGALAVGIYEHEDGEPRLRYAGKVGTGFTEETLAMVMRELEPLRRERSPFDGRQPPKGTVYVEPRLVARIEFGEWTRAGTLRAPSFKGLRDDVEPTEVGRES